MSPPIRFKLCLHLLPPYFSVSTSLGNLTVGVAPDGLAAPLPDISGEVEVFSLILYDQNSFEGEVNFIAIF